jgi:hypothetical protein
MEYIPKEIIHVIFSFLHISSKRQFIRTCHTYSFDIIPYEKKFQKMIINMRYLCYSMYTEFYNPLYKFTIELLYDNYPIPDHYIIPENRVFNHNKINYKIGQDGNLEFIKKISEINKNYITNIANGAASMGHIYVLKWIYEKYGNIYPIVSYNAAKNNQFETLKWLKDINFYNRIRITDYVAECGNIKMMKWCIKDNAIITGETLHIAANNGHVEMVKYLYKKYPKETEKNYYSIGTCGDLELLKWAMNERDDLDFLQIYLGATRKGHLHILEYLSNNNILPNDEYNVICDNAIMFNKFNILKWAKSKLNKCSWSNNYCMYAYINGNLEMIKYLSNNGHVCSNNNFSSAAIYGHFKILKWGVEEGYNIGIILIHSTLNSNLEIIRWCVERGEKLSNDIIIDAVRWGNLNIIKWALSQGYNLSPKACKEAIKHGNLGIFKYAIDSGHVFGKKVIELIYKNGDKMMIEYLKKKKLIF